MGLATGFTSTYSQLLLCRTLLGFFEAGHWPCALKTTQRLLTAKERTLGNSILQSGASIGAIITPQIIKYSLTDDLSSWRLPFQAIGAIGFGWAVLWLLSMRKSDFQKTIEHPGPVSAVPTKAPVEARSALSLARRIAVVVVVVLAINACWHLFRVWLPKFLQQGRGYSESFSLDFIFWYYIATDVGCILAGMASVWLIKRGLSTAMARWIVFTGCSMVTLLSVGVALTPKSNLLLIQLLFLAAGSLGLFPCYYALTQEISTKHLGKVTGILGAIAWATSPMHTWFGDYIDTHQSFDLGFAIVGCLPLVAALFWLAVWDWSSEGARQETVSPLEKVPAHEPAGQS
jgi:ACS family hexuronate transporter-like MFS transporter